MKIKPQVIEDLVTGLVIQFKNAPDGTARMIVLSDSFELGNRDFVFNQNGELSGLGTYIGQACPSHEAARLMRLEEANETD